MAKTIDDAWLSAELLTARTIVHELLEDRFGFIPEELRQRLAKCTDLTRLVNAARQVYRVASLAEFEF